MTCRGSYSAFRPAAAGALKCASVRSHEALSARAPCGCRSTPALALRRRADQRAVLAAELAVQAALAAQAFDADADHVCTGVTALRIYARRALSAQSRLHLILCPAAHANGNAESLSMTRQVFFRLQAEARGFEIAPLLLRIQQHFQVTPDASVLWRRQRCSASAKSLRKITSQASTSGTLGDVYTPQRHQTNRQTPERHAAEDPPLELETRTLLIALRTPPAPARPPGSTGTAPPSLMPAAPGDAEMNRPMSPDNSRWRSMPAAPAGDGSRCSVHRRRSARVRSTPSAALVTHSTKGQPDGSACGYNCAARQI